MQHSKGITVGTYTVKTKKKVNNLPICPTCKKCKDRKICSNRKKLSKCSICKNCKNAEQCDISQVCHLKWLKSRTKILLFIDK